jgi:hypothetical protein
MESMDAIGLRADLSYHAHAVNTTIVSAIY